MERNELLEQDGLYWQSDTHEWYKDKSTTLWAQREDSHGTKLPEIYGFIVRDKTTGEYNRVLMDNSIGELIYESKNLEAVGVHIDMLKASKRYK